LVSIAAEDKKQKGLQNSFITPKFFKYDLSVEIISEHEFFS